MAEATLLLEQSSAAFNELFGSGFVLGGCRCFLSLRALGSQTDIQQRAYREKEQRAWQSNLVCLWDRFHEFAFNATSNPLRPPESNIRASRVAYVRPEQRLWIGLVSLAQDS